MSYSEVRWHRLPVHKTKCPLPSSSVKIHTPLNVHSLHILHRHKTTLLVCKLRKGSVKIDFFVRTVPAKSGSEPNSGVGSDTGAKCLSGAGVCCLKKKFGSRTPGPGGSKISSTYRGPVCVLRTRSCRGPVCHQWKRKNSASNG